MALRNAVGRVDPLSGSQKPYAEIVPLAQKDRAATYQMLNALQLGDVELSRAKAEVEVKRQHLAAAARDRQAIDKLKERQQAEHDAEWARKSQNTLDELALAVHRRSVAA